MQSLLLVLASLLLVEASGRRKGGLGRRKEREGDFVLIGEGEDYIEAYYKEAYDHKEAYDYKEAYDDDDDGPENGGKQKGEGTGVDYQDREGQSGGEEMGRKRKSGKDSPLVLGRYCNNRMQKFPL